MQLFEYSPDTIDCCHEQSIYHYASHSYPMPLNGKKADNCMILSFCPDNLVRYCLLKTDCSNHTPYRKLQISNLGGLSAVVQCTACISPEYHPAQ